MLEASRLSVGIYKASALPTIESVTDWISLDSETVFTNGVIPCALISLTAILP